MSNLVSRGGRLLKYLVLATAITIPATFFFFSHGFSLRRSPSVAKQPPKLPAYIPIATGKVPHPIDQLIQEGHKNHQRLLRKQSLTVESAAEQYRRRRGRHPPPRFGEWFEYAKEKKAVVVEEYFDRIYDDLKPFWAIAPATVRTQANSQLHVVRVRNGKASFDTDDKPRVPWIQLWTKLIEKDAAGHLPDVDMPINVMDETRLLVPWEEINQYVAVEESQRVMAPPDEIISTYSGLKETDEQRGESFDAQWIRNGAGQYWDMAKESCPPKSEARGQVSLPESTLQDPFLLPTDWQPPYSWHGFVRNFTASQDICVQPHLRGMHGTFIESISIATTRQMIPMFGGSKLQINNEILIPGAMYITDDEMYSGGDVHGDEWAQKTATLIWRGVASGGRNKIHSWHHFQRHRFVQMMNATVVSEIERSGLPAQTFDLPDPAIYNLTQQREHRLGDWLSKISDAAFIELLCFPRENPGSLGCPYTEPYFNLSQKVHMSKMYSHKFLPDIDGNSFSARWRGFLLSTSLPLKATIYAEWHDSRMTPWVHFVPFDNTFRDMYGILDYFTFNEDRDQMAWRIAEEGRQWANQVFRMEDMRLYVWRLLLEFARICDENREKMGWVEDLIS